MLDEASAVSSMLFLDEGDMAHRYQKAYEREDALDATAAAAAAATGGTGIGSGRLPDTNRRTSPSALFGETSLFLPGGGGGCGDGGGGGFTGRGSGGMQGGILAAAAGGSAPLGAVDIRPEEMQFCDAFLELQSLLVRLAAAAAARATLDTFTAVGRT